MNTRNIVTFEMWSELKEYIEDYIKKEVEYNNSITDSDRDWEVKAMTITSINVLNDVLDKMKDIFIEHNKENLGE